MMQNDLKVAQLCSDYVRDSDGISHDYLLMNNHKSIILTENIYKDISVEKGIFSLYNTPKTIFIKVLNKYFNKWYLFYFNHWALRVLKKEKPNILHVHFFYNVYKFKQVLKCLNLPTIVTVYGVDGSSMLLDKKMIKKYKSTFKLINKLIVLSEIVKNRFIDIGFDPHKIELWNIPINLSSYNYKKIDFTDVNNFICAARFVEKKGYKFLLDAFQKFHSISKNSKLIILGYGEAFQKKSIEDQIFKLGINNCVKIIDTKFLKDFQSIYKNILNISQVFILASTTSKNGDDEGGPALTLIAAQSAGLAVICTPFVGSEISVIDNKTGIFCLQDNPQSIFEKMLLLKSNKILCENISLNASQFVNLNFDQKIQYKKLLNFYYDIQDT